MNQTQIGKSITARRLPYSFTDWFGGVVVVVFVGVMIYVAISTPDHGEPFPLFMSLGFSGVAILIGVQKLYFNLVLKYYASELTIAQKQDILGRMLAASDKIKVKSQSAQYAIFSYRQSWLVTYHIRLLYDDKGYYINSLKGQGKEAWFADKGIYIVGELIMTMEKETLGSKTIHASSE